MIIKACNVKIGNGLITGSYDTFDEEGNNVKEPIIETVTLVKRDDEQQKITVVTEENPDDPLYYFYDENIKVII